MEEKTREQEVNTLLKSAINNIKEAIPLIEQMKGVIPQETLNLLDSINRYSVMY